jgi:hypothetical protein
VALLPRRVWDNWDLPVANVAPASSLLTLLGGAALGIAGYFASMRAVLEGTLFTPPPLMLVNFLGYVFVTPQGLFSLYLVISGLVRAVSAYIDEPFGDPILTGADHAVQRTLGRARLGRARSDRLALERDDEPDRLYTGEWAGLKGVDFVIVAARRKPGWTRNTVVITDDGWFILGEAFDRPMPHGLRTVYPLTRHTTLEVLRKGVHYQLPPLREPRAS